MKKQESLGVSRGFISVYALFLLSIILVFTSTMVQKIKTNCIQEDSVSNAEIYAIQKVEHDLEKYKEKDETTYFYGHRIDLKYDDTTCHIQIYTNQDVVLNSVLKYDDIDNYIIDYSYE